MKGYKDGTTNKDQLKLPVYHYRRFSATVYIDLKGVENDGKETIIVHPYGVPNFIREKMTVDHIPYDMEATLAYEAVGNRAKKVYHLDRETLNVIAEFDLI
jgi:hypothetical protein